MSEDAPKAQEGTWTLTAPDGRTWTGKSPINVAGQEVRGRVPVLVRVKRVLSAIQHLDAEEPDGDEEMSRDIAEQAYFDMPVRGEGLEEAMLDMVPATCPFCEQALPDTGPAIVDEADHGCDYCSHLAYCVCE